MSDTPNIVNQADALMQRHRRSFVAGAVADIPVVETAAVDDLPVLTEVVDEVAVAPNLTSAQIEALVAERLAEALAQRQIVLEKELATWLDTHLPEAVGAAADRFADQLMAQLTVQAKFELMPRLLAALQHPQAGVDSDLGNLPQAE